MYAQFLMSHLTTILSFLEGSPLRVINFMQSSKHIYMLSNGFVLCEPCLIVKPHDTVVPNSEIMTNSLDGRKMTKHDHKPPENSVLV